MGKCYCDYCDVFLTNDSVAVRKQHNDGNRHKYNVCEYYRQLIGTQVQEEIDEIVAQFELKVARGLIRPTYAIPVPPRVGGSNGGDGSEEVKGNGEASKGERSGEEKMEKPSSPKPLLLVQPDDAQTLDEGKGAGEEVVTTPATVTNT